MKLAFKLPSRGVKLPPGMGGRFARLRKQARGLLGYTLLFLLVFAGSLVLFLPTEAIAWRIGKEARKRGFTVDVVDVSVTPFGGATLHEVTWIYEPSRPGQIPQNFYFEEVDVDVSLLALLAGDLDIEVDAHLPDSDAVLHGEYRRLEEKTEIVIKVEELPLSQVPKLQQAVNTPVSGLFSFSADLSLPEHKMVNAEGSMTINCTSCMISDGEQLLYVPGVKKGMLATGVTIPPVDLGSIAGTLVVAGGKAATEGIETSSDDVTLKFSGEMDLRDPFNRSTLDFRLKLMIAESLQEKSDSIRLMVAGASSKARLDKPEEGWLGYKLIGKVSRPRFRPWKYKTRAELQREKRERQRKQQAKRRARNQNKNKNKGRNKGRKKPKVEPKKEPAPEPDKKAEEPRDRGESEDRDSSSAPEPSSASVTAVAGGGAGGSGSDDADESEDEGEGEQSDDGAEGGSAETEGAAETEGQTETGATGDTSDEEGE